MADPNQPIVAGAHGSDAMRVGDLPPKPSFLSHLLAAFAPNRAVSGATMKAIVLFQVLALLVLWLNSPFEVLPKPQEVWAALQTLWLRQGLGRELISSFRLNLEALAITTLISLALSYLTVLPFFRPVAAAVSKGRFLSLVGFSLIFTLMVGGGHELKLWLLVFGMTVFFVTSMASVIAEIPKADFDHARTLRMGEWRVVWEVVVLGTADKAFEVMRQNAAIGWLMLTMVEGISRSEGGVGVLLLNMQKYFRVADVFAIQLVILLIALFQDYIIGALRRLVCPYADITKERR
jgi:NitT/TauT family transport system permease protein